MKKIISFILIFITALSLFAFNIFSAPAGNILIEGTKESDGNIFFITLTLTNGQNVRGGQGKLTFDPSIISVLDIDTSQLPDGVVFDANELNGELFFIFYSKDKNAINLSDSSPFLNVYFYVNSEPSDTSVVISLQDGILSDGNADITYEPCSHSVTIKDYVSTQKSPPVTAVTKPVQTQTEEATNNETDTETSTDVGLQTVFESDLNSEIPTTSDLPKTGTPLNINIVYVIMISCVCALISGSIVYIVMKKRKPKNNNL